MRPTRLMLLRSTSIHGGPERLIIGFARRLDPRAFDPVVVTFTEDMPEGNPFPRAAADNGLKTAVLEADGGFDGDAARRLANLARDLEIDLLCPQDYRADFYAISAGRRLGVPVVATAHGYTYQTPKVRLYELIDHIILRRADAVICVSEKLRTHLRKWGVPDSKLHRVYNSVDVNEIPPDSRTPGLPNPIVCAIGRLSIEKGHRYLIDAWPDILTRFPSARLVMVGDGPERPPLIAQVGKLGIKSSVEFTGFVDSPLDYLRRCAVFALPSLTEGLPVALLEACAAQKAIVATHVGGIGEVISSGRSGLLVRPKRPRELAESITHILEHPDQARVFAENARATVERKFSYEANVPLLEDVYRSCLRNSA
ncbi:MAG: glycosyltransferase family 4 protein [Armatimonadetes bacterium]|nr:glycosyltransferase family 4 protein [Armatimonadota bacterium]